MEYNKQFKASTRHARASIDNAIHRGELDKATMSDIEAQGKVLGLPKFLVEKYFA